MAAQLLGQIYNSEEIAAVRFDEQSQCWVGIHPSTKKQTLRLKGVRSTLSKSCWPSYSYREAEKLHPTSSSSTVPTGLRNPRHGRIRGIQIHEQLGMVASHGYEAMCAHLRQKHPNRNDKRGQPHEFVKHILHRFEQLRWTLVASELPVYNDRYGSSIDLVCLRRKNNTLILIELKVGGDNYHRKANGRMQGVLASSGIDNSPLSQALVQLGAYKLLFHTCYSKYISGNSSIIDSCRVIFVGQSGIHIEKLEDEKWEKMAEPLASLLFAPPDAQAGEGK